MTNKNKIDLIHEMISAVLECTDYGEGAKEALLACIEAVILMDGDECECNRCHG